jgi:hypothetical protein
MVLQPDQAAFTASVTAGVNSTEADILAAVAPVGLTAANLTGISGGAIRLTYNFSWSVPISKINETASALQSARIAFQVTGAGVSDDLRAPASCSTSDLLADAQTQARKMAAAIGGTVGPVLAVSNSNSVSSPVAVGSFLVAGFSFSGSVTPFFLPASTQLNCSLTFKFRLN